MSYQRMNDEKHLKSTEGISILYDSCFERCCKKYKITEDQLEALNVLRARARIPFNKENSVHNELLKGLWRMSFPEVEYPSEGKSDKWKEIGFQGRDPATDFRGAGLLGLEQLVYLASNYPQEYKEMSEKAKNYSFAISALNITVPLN
jgi:ELMO domain-containing protein